MFRGRWLFFFFVFGVATLWFFLKGNLWYNRDPFHCGDKKVKQGQWFTVWSLGKLEWRDKNYDCTIKYDSRIYDKRENGMGIEVTPK